ncbi:MAG: fused MFS/spermidine synthase [Magnetococcales bacterium]|nr:fused MFS/spermidine synthase [Magnetococcales bacterium]
MSNGVMGGPAKKKLLYRQFWQGQLIEVIQEGPFRSLRFDSHLVQSRMLESDPDKLVLNYARHMTACLMFLAEPPKNILMIGLGGGSIVRFFLKYYPDCQIKVVEFNECIPRLARKYFLLPKESAKLSISIDDGTRYVETTKPIPGGYDLILVDAFDNTGMAQTVYTGNFFKSAKVLLSANGLMALNMTKGEKAFFERGVDMLRDCFNGSLLRLPVDKTNNEIIIVSNKPQTWGDFSQPKKRAKQLSKLFDIDLKEFLDQIMPTGNNFWNRWLKVGKQK